MREVAILADRKFFVGFRHQVAVDAVLVFLEYPEMTFPAGRGDIVRVYGRTWVCHRQFPVRRVTVDARGGYHETTLQ